MIEKNRPPGILPVSVRFINEKTEYWYDVTGHCSLAAYEDKAEWKPQRIRAMIKRVLSVYQDLEQYLLNGSNLVLDVRYVFTDKDEELLFCYGPEQCLQRRSQVSEFLWFLLSNMEHDDTAQTAELYGLYHRLHKGAGNPTEILTEIERKPLKRPDIERQEQQSILQKNGETVKREEHREEEPTRLSMSVFQRIGHIIARRTSSKGTGHTGNQSEIQEDAAQSHCFLRSCGELVLETSELNHSPFLIGSSRTECHLWIVDPAVSRIHAKLLYERGRWYIMDAGSVNGTKWNQIPVRRGEKRELQPGDQLDFAGIVYVFDRLGGEGIRLDNPYRNE